MRVLRDDCLGQLCVCVVAMVHPQNPETRFLLSHLRSATLQACLDWIEVGECYLNDTPWFVEHFPAVIQLKSTMEVFNLLQKINT